VVPNGTCVSPGLPIPIVDATGRTTTVTFTNVRGTLAIPDLVVSPSTVTLSDCNAQATVSIAGGTGTFTASSGSGALTITSNQSVRQIVISRNHNFSATSPLSVGVASGSKAATIAVILTGDALNTRCDESSLSIFPSSVSFAGCGFADITVTGGQPPYGATTDNGSVTACLGGAVGCTATDKNIIRITRVPGSPALVSPGTVNIVDSSSTIPRIIRPVTVNVTGTCP
jgi:hypothetical protein